MLVVPVAARVNDAVLPSHTVADTGCVEMVIRSGNIIVKSVLLVALPAGVVIEIFPEVLVPTTAVMLVDDTTLNEVAALPPKVTEVAPVKFVPVMVTVVPAIPLVGVKLVMVGSDEAVTEKVPVLTCVHSPPLSLART